VQKLGIDRPDGSVLFVSPFFVGSKSKIDVVRRYRQMTKINPLSPPAAPVQGRLQGPPAKSKFLAVIISSYYFPH